MKNVLQFVGEAFVCSSVGLLILAMFFAWVNEPRVYLDSNEDVIFCEVVIDGELERKTASWYEKNKEKYFFVEYVNW